MPAFYLQSVCAHECAVGGPVNHTRGHVPEALKLCLQERRNTALTLLSPLSFISISRVIQYRLHCWKPPVHIWKRGHAKVMEWLGWTSHSCKKEEALPQSQPCADVGCSAPGLFQGWNDWFTRGGKRRVISMFFIRKLKEKIKGKCYYCLYNNNN